MLPAAAASIHVHRVLLLGATAVNWLVAGAWVYRAVDLQRNLHRVPNLLAAPAAEAAEPALPLLAVIVPACNEAAAIGQTLRSLLRQEGVPLEIVAVNDRSRDRTGAIMEEVAAEAASIASPGVTLRVVHIQALPDGWMGKQHALAAGVAAATAPYLLFTDGDIYFRQDALRRAMRFVMEERADHLVLLPTPIIQGLGEHMMISAVQVFSAWAVRLWRIADPDSKDRLGVGAFNLVQREAYDAIGGFAALRMEVLEDVRLGVEIKRHRLRQRVAFGRDLVTVHWAEGIGGVIANVTKNFFAATRFVVSRMLVGCCGLGMLGIYPALCLLGPLPMRVASGVWLLALLAMYGTLRRPGGSSRVYALLFPAATALLMYAMLRSMTITLARGAVQWRGTSYPLAELRRQAGPLY